MAIDAGSIYSEVRVALDKLKGDITAMETEFNKINKISSTSSKESEQAWTKGFDATALAGVAAFAAISAAVKAAVTAFADFDDSMAQVRAVMTGSEQDFRMLEDAAVDVGKAADFSAKEAADSLYELARRGFEASESVQLLGEAQLLAGATGSDLVTATKALVSTMGQFGIAADDANRIVEVMAASRMPLQEFTGTLAAIGPAAAGMGIPLENIIGVLRALQKTGMESGMATMALKTILGDLSDTTSPLVKKLAEMGVAFESVNPATNSFAEIVGALTEKGIGASEAMALFGNRAGPAMAALIAEGRAGIEEYTASVTGATVAEQMYQDRNNSLGDSFRDLGNLVNTAAVAVTKEFAPILNVLVNIVKEAVKFITNLPGPLKLFLGIAAAGIPIVIGIASAVKLLGAALTASAGIISVVILAIGAMVAIISAVANSFMTAEKATDELNQAVNDLRKTNEQLDKINKQLQDSTKKLTDIERDRLEVQKALIEQQRQYSVGEVIRKIQQNTTANEDVTIALEKQKKLYAQVKKEMEDHGFQTQLAKEDVENLRAAYYEAYGPLAALGPKTQSYGELLTKIGNYINDDIKRQTDLNGSYNNGIDELANLVLVQALSWDQLDKLSPKIAEQVAIRVGEIRALKQQNEAEEKLAETKKTNDEADKKRKDDMVARYNTLIGKVRSVISSADSEIERIQKEIIAIQNAGFDGEQDKIDAANAILILEAKIADIRKKANDDTLNIRDDYLQKTKEIGMSETELAEEQRKRSIAEVEASAGTRAAKDEAIAAVNKYYDAVRDDSAEKEMVARQAQMWDALKTMAYSAAGSLQELIKAIADERVNELDRQLKAELKAKGLAEKTEIERLQSEYDEAVKTGDAKVIEEKRIALERAKITEDYEKKKARIIYQAELARWEIGLAMAIADTVQALIKASTALPWPFNLITIAGQAALSGIQMAAYVASRPKPPTFTGGGIVLGNSYSGDKVDAKVNSGEMILNKDQQTALFNALNSGSGIASGGPMMIQLFLEGRVIAETSAKYYNDGLVRLKLG